MVCCAIKISYAALIFIFGNPQTDHKQYVDNCVEKAKKQQDPEENSSITSICFHEINVI